MAAAAGRTIAVVAATGRTGSHAVDILRERDYKVIAIGRNEEKLAKLFGGKEGVETRVADVFEADAVRDALAGADAVLATAGYVIGGKAPPPYVATATNVINGMRAHSIKRLVFMGSSGVLQPADRPSCGFNAFLWVARWIFCAGSIIDDQERAFHDVIKTADDVDWVYVRPDTLKDGEGGAELVVGDMGSVPLKAIDRRDVARFMVDQLESDELVHQAKIVTPR